MFNTALDDEPEILQQLTGGDELAFARLYQHYYSSVHSTVQHILPSPQLVEDVTQEIFLKLWENRSKLGEIRTFRSYLFIITRNHALSVLKRAARTKAGLAELIRHSESGHNPTEDALISHEYLQFINRKLAELPPRSRQVFHMCREESKTYDEVAAALGISRDAVKSRMMHAIKFLRTSSQKELGLPLAVIMVAISRF